MFNPNRMIVARMRRKLTNKLLASKAGLTSVTISRIEQGVNEPERETVVKIANILRYPENFFYGDDLEVIPYETISFRSLKRMSARERNAAIAAASLGIHVTGFIEKRFNLPKVDLIDLSYETDIETAARGLRQHWRIGEKPIRNMLKLLEAKGIRIFSLADGGDNVDAFSFWTGERPFIFLNTFKTAERSIFDCAHELGHLILHKHAGSKHSRSEEYEANLFASAFLMPEADFRANIPKLLNANNIIKFKTRWRVSAMALAFRAHKLKILSDWRYRSICIELGRRGFRTDEPTGIKREQSIVWQQIFTQLWKEKITKEKIAKILDIPIDELNSLLFGLACSHAVANRNRTPLLKAVK